MLKFLRKKKKIAFLIRKMERMRSSIVEMTDKII